MQKWTKKEIKKKGTSLTPNEKHLYWQEICKHEDLSRDNFHHRDKIEIYNAVKPSVTKHKFTKEPHKEAEISPARLFVIPTNTTAKMRKKTDKESCTKEKEDNEQIRSFFMRGMNNIRFSNPGGVRVMANTTMGETLYNKGTSIKKPSKISKLESEIEHEKYMKELAEKELMRLKSQIK